MKTRSNWPNLGGMLTDSQRCIPTPSYMILGCMVTKIWARTKNLTKVNEAWKLGQTDLIRVDTYRLPKMHPNTKLHDPRLYNYWDLSSDVKLNPVYWSMKCRLKWPTFTRMLSVSQRCIRKQSFMTTSTSTWHIIRVWTQPGTETQTMTWTPRVLQKFPSTS